MTIFNELLRSGKYPNLKIKLTNGKTRVIKSVQFFSVFEINGKEIARVWTVNKNEPITIENIEYVYNTFFD